jgi:hypothetical protein
MASPARESAPSGAEKQLRARDAHSSVTILSLLILVAQINSYFGARDLPRALPLASIWLNVALSTAALAYLVPTRRRPREDVAVMIGWGWVAFNMMLMMWFAREALLIHRPWEAFAIPRIWLSAFGLVAPSFLVGLSICGVYVEALGIYFWFRLAGIPVTQIPIAEPWAMTVFFLIGLSLLFLRRRRDLVARRYIRTAAEVTALQRLSLSFGGIGDQLERHLRVLTEGLTGLEKWQPAPSEMAGRSVRAIDRLRKVRERLGELARPTTPEPAPAPTQATGDELLLYARDAQASGVLLAVASLVAAVVTIGSLREFLPPTGVMIFAAQAAASTGSLWYLHRTRARPSELRGVTLALLAVVPYLFYEVFTTSASIRSGTAFDPLLANKALALLFPLAVGRYLWLGIALEAIVTVHGAILFWTKHLFALRDRIPEHEPWLTLLYLYIGIGVMLVADYRRGVSLKLLRADRDLAASSRRAGLQVALLDQLGSPVQTLVLDVEALRQQRPDDQQVMEMAEAVRALGKLRGQVRVDEGTLSLVSENFDGAEALLRQ